MSGCTAIRLPDGSIRYVTTGPGGTMGTPTAEQLRALRSQGQAMAPATPGGRPRFYIRNADDLGNAIRAVGRAAGDHNAVRRYIIGRAKALGLSSRIPDNWAADGSMKDGGSQQ